MPPCPSPMGSETTSLGYWNQSQVLHILFKPIYCPDKVFKTWHGCSNAIHLLPGNVTWQVVGGRGGTGPEIEVPVILTHSAKLSRCSWLPGTSVLSPPCLPGGSNRNPNEPEAQGLQKVSRELVLVEMPVECRWRGVGDREQRGRLHKKEVALLQL